MAITIRRERWYVLQTHPGISGFKDFARYEYRIVTSQKARLYRSDVACEVIEMPDAMWRLEDGHLPNLQPVVSTAAAIEWLQANPYNSIQLAS